MPEQIDNLILKPTKERRRKKTGRKWRWMKQQQQQSKEKKRGRTSEDAETIVC